VLAPQHSLGPAIVLLFIAGVCFTLYTANSNAVLQLRAPDHLRGRVIGFYYFAFNGLAPLGGILTGWLAATGGTELAFGVAGTVTALVALAAVPQLPYVRAEAA
jgi:MFS family permease